LQGYPEFENDVFFNQEFSLWTTGDSASQRPDTANRICSCGAAGRWFRRGAESGFTLFNQSSLRAEPMEKNTMRHSNQSKKCLSGFFFHARLHPLIGAAGMLPNLQRPHVHPSSHIIFWICRAWWTHPTNYNGHWEWGKSLVFFFDVWHRKNFI